MRFSGRAQENGVKRSAVMFKYLNSVGVHMVELKRTIKCSNCGSESSFYLSTDTSINELLLHGRCQKCGNSMQINYNMVDSSQMQQSTISPSASTSSEQIVNLDESLFGSEAMSSDALRDIIED